MNLAASWTHDVLGADSTNQQGIGDERAMTAPRHRFGAHQCDPVLVRQLDQFFEALLKFRRLHVIRITSKGSISPAHVERIALSMTQPAESWHVNVAQAGFLQRAWQRSLIKLWVVPGARHRPHIYYARYSVCLKQADEFLERACGMPNRQYDRRRFCPWHSFSSKTSCLSIDSGHAHFDIFPHHGRTITLVRLQRLYNSCLPSAELLSRKK